MKIISQMALKAVLLPIVLLYWAVERLNYGRMNFENRFYAKNRLPMIVVGALRIGGSGKTSLVIELANRFKDSGLRVAILCYWINKSDFKTYMQTSGNDWQNTSDEACLIHSETGLDTFVTKNRRKTWCALENLGKYDILISDDGYQDPRLKNAIHVLLKKSGKKPGFFDLWPLGAYRCTENRGKKPDYFLEGPFLSEKSPLGNRFVRQLYFPKNFEKQKEWAAISALGNNRDFIKVLMQKGINLKGYLLKRDHQPFSEREILKVSKCYNCAGILTTQKDAIKLTPPLKKLVTVVTQKVLLPHDLFDKLMNHIRIAF